MNKKTVRVISTILTIAIVLMGLTGTAFADNNTVVKGPSSYIDTNVNELTGGKIGSIGKSIISTISTVAMIVAVVVLMVLGIKYMMGSAEEKASYKKTMIPYLVGAVLVFGAGFVADMVYSFATGLK